MEQVFFIAAILLSIIFLYCSIRDRKASKSPYDIIVGLTPVIINLLDSIQELISIKEYDNLDDYKSKVADLVSKELWDELQKEEDNSIMKLLNQDLIKFCVLKLFDDSEMIDIAKIFKRRKEAAYIDTIMNEYDDEVQGELSEEINSSFHKLLDEYDSVNIDKLHKKQKESAYEEEIDEEVDTVDITEELL